MTLNPKAPVGTVKSYYTAPLLCFGFSRKCSPTFGIQAGVFRGAERARRVPAPQTTAVHVRAARAHLVGP